MTRSHITAALVFTFATMLTPESADADTGAEWRVDGQLATRVNPTGVRLTPSVALRRGLFDSDNALLKGAYVEIGTSAPSTPVSVFNHVYVEAVPVAPILLRASATRLRYFGVLGVMKTFDNGGDDWSPEVLDGAMEEGGGVSTSGTDASLLAKLRLKFGNFLATATYDQHWISVKIPNTSNWYDPYTDLLLTQADQYTLTTGFAGYVVDGNLDSDRFLLLAGKYEKFETKRSDVSRQLANLMAVWRPGWRAQDKLTVGTVLGYYLEDAYRKDQIVVALFAAVSWGGPLSE